MFSREFFFFENIIASALKSCIEKRGIFFSCFCLFFYRLKFYCNLSVIHEGREQASVLLSVVLWFLLFAALINLFDGSFQILFSS